MIPDFHDKMNMTYPDMTQSLMTHIYLTYPYLTQSLITNILMTYSIWPSLKYPCLYDLLLYDPAFNEPYIWPTLT